MKQLLMLWHFLLRSTPVFYLYPEKEKIFNITKTDYGETSYVYGNFPSESGYYDEKWGVAAVCTSDGRILSSSSLKYYFFKKPTYRACIESGGEKVEITHLILSKGIICKICTSS